MKEGKETKETQKIKSKRVRTSQLRSCEEEDAEIDEYGNVEEHKHGWERRAQRGRQHLNHQAIGIGHLRSILKRRREHAEDRYVSFGPDSDGEASF